MTLSTGIGLAVNWVFGLHNFPVIKGRLGSEMSNCSPVCRVHLTLTCDSGGRISVDEQLAHTHTHTHRDGYEWKLVLVGCMSLIMCELHLYERCMETIV